MFGVYRVARNGKLTYVSRSATENENLAKEIAAGLSRGEIVMPDGSIKHVISKPHVVKRIREENA